MRRRVSVVVPAPPGERVCCFCGLEDDDEISFGKIYEHNGIITHYYCLLLSSNMEQRGNDDEGILGFLPEDINKEIKRGRRLACCYCRKVGATLGCCNTKCRKIFHFPCGLKAGSLHQFFGEFRSYCPSHRPEQKIDKRVITEVSQHESMICYICYDDVDPHDMVNTLWAPCCKKNAWFHRTCVQQLAMSAGYFFKCPLCNNKNDFQKAMLDQGIFIPSQDASWELVPNAFEELLYRHNRCDADKCMCPKGREHTSTNAKWELTLCRTCGSQGIHMACGNLKWAKPAWECLECTLILNKSASPGRSKKLKSARFHKHRTVGDLLTDDENSHSSSASSSNDSDISVGGYPNVSMDTGTSSLSKTSSYIDENIDRDPYEDTGNYLDDRNGLIINTNTLRNDNMNNNESSKSEQNNDVLPPLTKKPRIAGTFDDRDRNSNNCDDDVIVLSGPSRKENAVINKIPTSVDAERSLDLAWQIPNVENEKKQDSRSFKSSCNVSSDRSSIGEQRVPVEIDLSDSEIYMPENSSTIAREESTANVLSGSPELQIKIINVTSLAPEVFAGVPESKCEPQNPKNLGHEIQQTQEQMQIIRFGDNGTVSNDQTNSVVYGYTIPGTNNTMPLVLSPPETTTIANTSTTVQEIWSKSTSNHSQSKDYSAPAFRCPPGPKSRKAERAAKAAAAAALAEANASVRASEKRPVNIAPKVTNAAFCYSVPIESVLNETIPVSGTGTITSTNGPVGTLVKVQGSPIKPKITSNDASTNNSSGALISPMKMQAQPIKPKVTSLDPPIQNICGAVGSLVKMPGPPIKPKPSSVVTPTNNTVGSDVKIREKGIKSTPSSVVTPTKNTVASDVKVREKGLRSKPYFVHGSTMNISGNVKSGLKIHGPPVQTQPTMVETSFLVNIQGQHMNAKETIVDSSKQVDKESVRISRVNAAVTNQSVPSSMGHTYSLSQSESSTTPTKNFDSSAGRVESRLPKIAPHGNGGDISMPASNKINETGLSSGSSSNVVVDKASSIKNEKGVCSIPTNNAFQASSENCDGHAGSGPATQTRSAYATNFQPNIRNENAHDATRLCELGEASDDQDRSIVDRTIAAAIHVDDASERSFTPSRSHSFNRTRLINKTINLRDLKFTMCGPNVVKMTLYDTYSININVDSGNKNKYKPRRLSSIWEEKSSNSPIKRMSKSSRNSINHLSRNVNSDTEELSSEIPASSPTSSIENWDDMTLNQTVNASENNSITETVKPANDPSCSEVSTHSHDELKENLDPIPLSMNLVNNTASSIDRKSKSFRAGVNATTMQLLNERDTQETLNEDNGQSSRKFGNNDSFFAANQSKIPWKGWNDNASPLSRTKAVSSEEVANAELSVERRIDNITKSSTKRGSLIDENTDEIFDGSKRPKYLKDDHFDETQDCDEVASNGTPLNDYLCTSTDHLVNIVENPRNRKSLEDNVCGSERSCVNNVSYKRMKSLSRSKHSLGCKVSIDLKRICEVLKKKLNMPKSKDSEFCKYTNRSCFKDGNNEKECFKWKSFQGSISMKSRSLDNLTSLDRSTVERSLIVGSRKWKSSENLWSFSLRARYEDSVNGLCTISMHESKRIKKNNRNFEKHDCVS